MLSFTSYPKSVFLVPGHQTLCHPSCQGGEILGGDPLSPFLYSNSREVDVVGVQVYVQRSSSSAHALPPWPAEASFRAEGKSAQCLQMLGG